MLRARACCVFALVFSHGTDGSGDQRRRALGQQGSSSRSSIHDSNSSQAAAAAAARGSQQRVCGGALPALTLDCPSYTLPPPPSSPTARHQKFTPENVEFQAKILHRSGLGDDTYLPPGVCLRVRFACVCVCVCVCVRRAAR